MRFPQAIETILAEYPFADAEDWDGCLHTLISWYEGADGTSRWQAPARITWYRESNMAVIRYCDFDMMRYEHLYVTLDTERL